MESPSAFFNLRVHDLALSPTLCGLCVGYERGEWRAQALVDRMFEWMPEFVLNQAELAELGPHNSISLIRKAARTVYQTKKFEKRGEFGELLLHMAIREVHKSLPAVSKIYYKTAANDTVKGFDAVHVVGSPDDMELWLGEAKFYDNLSRATTDVIKELVEHLDTDYLRSEFMFIAGKMDRDWPHYERLSALLSEGTSLDEVFQRACFPVLLTYDSKCVEGHLECSQKYSEEFEAEIVAGHNAFVEKVGKSPLTGSIQIHLFLLPIEHKKRLVRLMDQGLGIWRQI